MSAGGEDPHAAHAAFCKTFQHVLMDMANEASPAIRQGQIDTTGFATAPATSPRTIAVTLKPVDQLRPPDNTANLEAVYATAA